MTCSIKSKSQRLDRTLSDDGEAAQELILLLKRFDETKIPYIVIHCDGACSGNPGPGGWGAVISYEEHDYDFFGGELHTTNNRMELEAAIHALEKLPRACQVDIYTDSQYLRDGVTKWLIGWKMKGWLTYDKKPVKNRDLWEQLDCLVGKHQINWHWLRGHSGNSLNERADTLARHGIVSMSMKTQCT